MGFGSKIEWTESTWNPVTGCTKVSSGCRHCYAETMANRLKAMGQLNYANGFKVTLQPHMLEVPLRWKRPQMVFVNSMSDLFHESIPPDYIQRVFQAMQRASWHTFQVLTKRAIRLEEIAPSLPWSQNIWMGVSVESENQIKRIDHLRATGAFVKFVSFEPLLGPVTDLVLRGIDWVIVGGESGPHARPMDASWVLRIRDQCQMDRVPFFFKQWGGPNKKRAGRILEDRTWDDMPPRLDVMGPTQRQGRSRVKNGREG